eukprot:GHVS01002617.1.p1 GENE.GHVS01002617.1~~GHVS01002617.1.p1  ORF type:complete len:171 (+),score=2.23 GHVS01002617.1:426-938(+)
MARGNKVKYYGWRYPYHPWGSSFLALRPDDQFTISYNSIFHCDNVAAPSRRENSIFDKIVGQKEYSFTGQQFCEHIVETGGLQYLPSVKVNIHQAVAKQVTWDKKKRSQAISTDVEVLVRGSFLLLHSVRIPVVIKRMKFLMAQTAPSVGPQGALYGPSMVTLFPLDENE